LRHKVKGWTADDWTMKEKREASAFTIEPLWAAPMSL